MQVQISGKNINIGQSLPQYITGELEGLVRKYFKDATDARVVVEKNGAIFKAEIRLNVNRYVGINTSAEAGDAYSAFLNALKHAAKKMRRKKRQIVDKHRVHHHAQLEQAL